MDENVRFRIDPGSFSWDEKSVTLYLKAVSKFYYKGKMPAARKDVLTMGVYTFIMACYLLASSAEFEKLPHSVLVLFSFYCAVYFLYGFFSFYRQEAKKIYTQFRALHDPTTVVQYTDKSVTFLSEKSMESYDYSLISSICCWNGYLTLFVPYKQIIIKEDDLADGTPEELHRFPSEKTGLDIIVLH